MSGAAVLHDLAVFVRRFVVLKDEQVVAVVLWIVHTHAFGAADTTPYIAITSAEKRCGKSRLLEVAELLVRQPLSTMNISDAALFRAIEKLTPTVLLDEVDSIFSPKARDREDLRGMLNAGYRSGALAWRMGGAQARTLESFAVFCPKMFAGIGELPDTVGDRTIRIRLQRRTRDESIERFRRREVQPEADELRDRIAGWAEGQLEELRLMEPELPSELDDRAQDFWEPLLAIAELVGGDWPARSQSAARALSTGMAREDDSLSALMLADIFAVFNESGVARFKTADLIAALSKIEESPWGDWKESGRPISANRLSMLLKPHGIRTMTVKVDGTPVRGYKVEQFTEAFARVLGVTRVTAVTSGSHSQAGSNAGNAANARYTAAASRGRRSYPRPGDPDFPDWIDGKLQDGHLGADEWEQRRKEHMLIDRHGDLEEVR